MKIKNDITGKKFGRLEVLSFSHRDKYSSTYWLCKCDCGTEKAVAGKCLNNNETRSCGCMRDELLVKRSTTHGMCGTPTYTTWALMVQRCVNAKDPSYKNYGGRGIKVCDRWLKFENFYEDMGEKPKGLLLDRTDNDGNYTPENCRWVSWFVQANNRRGNRMLTLNGLTMTMAQWSRKLKINTTTIHNRINIYGWSVEKALSCSG